MKSFLEDGYIYVRKIDDGEYYIVSKTGKDQSGYGIPRELDPSCAYDYKEAETYWNNNPDKRFEWEIPKPTKEEELRSEYNSLKFYLDSTDYAVIKCYDRGLSFKDEYPELYIERQKARDRINEIEKELGEKNE